MDDSPIVPRIESLSVKNYRTLQDFELRDLTTTNHLIPLSPLTVLLGPNGSGKSTVFDVFAFLSECFSEGLRRAWDRRGRFSELRSRGANGPIEFTLQYRERQSEPLITYHLSIDENSAGPYIDREFLKWKRGRFGQPFLFLDFKRGKGIVISGETPEVRDERIDEKLSSPDVLAVSTLGQLGNNPRVNALRSFVTSWYLSYISADSTRAIPESGPRERLSHSGDNLPNVIQHLDEQHPEKLLQILNILSERVPRLEKVVAEKTIDGRLVLQIKDAPFKDPVLAKYASDGTLKMLAYLTVLHDPEPPNLIGIEEPENQLHPRLLQELAEECRFASARSQLMVTTHSPYFVDGLKPEELWILYRDENGFTQARRASNMPGVKEFLDQGALLGNVWMEGHFDAGDPLTNAGGLQTELAI
ncbi:MAG: AAA family ATPase [Anaerolineaceae bacterium]|nr:AAA family ATPase [Anaerolineaceae bacterium]